ncbi:hypothetical protein CRE_31520 [Caenorhabditis remanei]|uniref:F-box domain-containing protein n=1 Tax=Caenorhabditis remanei TaxID=31234 RepID=E3NGG2_CAERE|nr:hypothetical protein CRE_31520 [Caenorhabditis remanei]
MSSPFPLLRLPRLVLGEVFKSLNLGEKIKLSFCSKKVSTQINNNRLYSQKVIVDLDMLNEKISVRSENGKDTFLVSFHLDFWKNHNSNTEQLSFKFCNVRVRSMRLRIRTFRTYHQEGFLSVIRHLLKMFQCKISTSESCYHSELFQPTISMLFDLQLEFKTLCILYISRSFLRSKDENLLFWNKMLSTNMGLIEDLRIMSIDDPFFIPVFTSWPREISILGYDWFTVESLLACTCTNITLNKSYMGNKDVDKILREWKAGGLPNLKHLGIISHNFKDNGEQIFGMNPMELDGMIIKTDDGSKTATIDLGQHWIEMSVTPFE